LVILADYPVQHFCPLYKELARNRSIGTIVIFANSKDVDAYFDEGLKKEISWGNGILEAFLYVSFAMSVSDVVDQLDVSAIESVYEEEDRGQPPYHPRMMTKIPLYGYCVGVFSSRRIQKRLVEDVAFRVLTADNQPDFRTIADFRKIHLKALEELFQQVLSLVLEVGALRLGRVALDGSKVKANATKHKAMSYGRMEETEKRLREEVRKLLKQAEITDEEDKRYGRHGGPKRARSWKRRIEPRKT